MTALTVRNASEHLGFVPPVPRGIGVICVTVSARHKIAETTRANSLVGIASARPDILAKQSVGDKFVFRVRKIVRSVTPFITRWVRLTVFLVLMESSGNNVKGTVLGDVQNVWQLCLGLTQTNVLSVCLGCMEFPLTVLSTAATAYRDFVQTTAAC